MFKILTKNKHTKTRLGVLNTPHGKIETPSYVIVATRAQIKCLKSSDIKKTKTQIIIANTYHLWDEILNPKLEIINKSQIRNYKSKTFLLKKLGTKLPTMTDSGGFQVFSLGFGPNRVGKILNTNPVDNRHSMSVIHRREKIRITEKGVYFKWDGKSKFLGPELSMKIQEKLGADIIFAFDECTSPLDSFDYNKKALERTHAWALKCLKTHNQRLTTNNKQMLFGIVQGGRFKSLRIKSAKYVASLPFDGIGIGGSFGKNNMVKTIKWVIPRLPREKPRHLLGIGKIEDIFNAVEQGIDLFDCVIPTREARHGRIYTKQGHFDIWKYQSDKRLLEKDCKCPTCLNKITRIRLRELFKGTEKEKQKAQRWATIHNVWFFNNLLEEIRGSIKNNKFKQFKNRFLNNFKS
ncbi:MAG: tRNA guanosine(34) transglycosylase Tgt [Candidatus Yanofskybacteria bacterium]|nr:tRNA guanosine(34) transglycosylase Tgt [Candidatus Yanofskybacteria bacterium]